jgi:F-type H+-transporting ATPase subunit epsilon
MPNFHFDLVSPERLVFSGEVSQVDVPGEAGEFGVFAGHAPYIATLKPGILKIYGDGAPKAIVVRGGFAEVNPDGLTVLAEHATPAEGCSPEVITQAIKDTEEDIADAKDEAARDKARERLSQLNMLKSALGQ